MMTGWSVCKRLGGKRLGDSNIEQRMASSTERGAALLTVLLLVAIMAVIAVSALDRLTLATYITGRASGIDQARFLALATEQIALRYVPDIAASRGSQWVGKEVSLPFPGGTSTGRLEDADNCFNLNSLVAETFPKRWRQRPRALLQFAALMESTGIPAQEAKMIAAATADWLDSDSNVGLVGAEDASYRRLSRPYLPSNRPMVDESELLAVQGVEAQYYVRLRPWICALPSNDLTRLNVNTLSLERTALIAMLAPGQISIANARAALAARPRGGYASTAAFWRAESMQGFAPPLDVTEHIIVSPRWLRLTTRVELGETQLTARALIDARLDRRGAKPQISARTWGESG